MRCAGFAVALASLASMLAGCNRTQPAPADPPPDPPKAASALLPEWDSEVFSGLPYYLEPVPREVAGPPPTAAEVLAGLFQGMADDKETRALLVRLHGGARVEFRVMQGADKEVARRTIPERPLAECRAVHWVVTSWTSYPIPKEDDKQAPGISRCLPVGVGWTYLFKLDLKAAVPSQIALLADSPQIMVLVCNDYLLRHQLGHQIRHDDFPPGNLAEYKPEERPPDILRGELDRKIAETVKRWNTLPSPGRK
jgi:hypothetical protein